MNPVSTPRTPSNSSGSAQVPLSNHSCRHRSNRRAGDAHSDDYSLPSVQPGMSKKPCSRPAAGACNEDYSLENVSVKGSTGTEAIPFFRTAARRMAGLPKPGRTDNSRIPHPEKKKAGSLPLSCPPLFSISLLLITPKLPFGKSDDDQHCAPIFPMRKRKKYFFAPPSAAAYFFGEFPCPSGQNEVTHKIFYKSKIVRRKNGQLPT